MIWRRSNARPTGPQASQLQSQASQQSFSQGISSQHGMFSQLSQNSLNEVLTNDQVWVFIFLENFWFFPRVRLCKIITAKPNIWTWFYFYDFETQWLQHINVNQRSLIFSELIIHFHFFLPFFGTKINCNQYYTCMLVLILNLCRDLVLKNERTLWRRFLACHH